MNSGDGEAAEGVGASGYRPRDFVETCEGLCFAVVAPGTEQGRVLGFLRYVRTGATLHKLNTADANQLLQHRYADYLYHSHPRDAAVHGVPVSRIVHHHQPAYRLAEIMAKPCPDPLETKVRQLVALVGGATGTPAWLGVTGSLLIAAHQAASDIDLVCYGREHFLAARQRFTNAVVRGALAELSDAMWRDAYDRRGCSLSFDDYLWHERRKRNKFACGATKVDISCIAFGSSGALPRGKKLCRAVIYGLVIDDTLAFDYPARYPLRHAAIGEVVSFTPTYTGQARIGEMVEAAGWVEQADDGRRRLTVGTSREAVGEWVKVMR